MPPAQPSKAIHLQQRGRDRRADKARGRNRHHERRHDARTVRCRNPVRQIQQHARKEPRLRRAQQEAQRVERGRPADQRRGGRDQPPRDHDPRDPDARAVALQRKVARHLEEEVRHEEQAAAEPKHTGCQPEVVVHLQRGHAHVAAVDESQQVADHEEWHEPPDHLAQGPLLEIGHTGTARHLHVCLLAPSWVSRRYWMSRNQGTAIGPSMGDRLAGIGAWVAQPGDG